MGSNPIFGTNIAEWIGHPSEPHMLVCLSSNLNFATNLLQGEYWSSIGSHKPDYVCSIQTPVTIYGLLDHQLDRKPFKLEKRGRHPHRLPFKWLMMRLGSQAPCLGVETSSILVWAANFNMPPPMDRRRVF